MRRASSSAFALLLAIAFAIGSGTAVAAPVPTLVKDIDVADGSSPQELTSVGSMAFFRASDDEFGAELWRSDGTTAGTQLVADISAGQPGSSPDQLTVVGETVYFTADDGVHGRELWRSDGTPSGTAMVADIAPGVASSGPLSLANVGGTIYFSADDGVHGYEPWTSDGTSEGTQILSDVRAGALGSTKDILAEFVGLNGDVFFAANDGVHGREIWRTNGTEAGTALLEDIYPGASSSGDTMLYTSAVPYSLTRAAGKLFFAANDGVAGTELWVSDGTAEGTRLLADLEPGSVGSLSRGYSLIHLGYLPEFVEVDGDLFFTTFVSGRELWKSDGTEAGTVRLVGNLTHLSDLADVNGTAFFQANCGHSVGSVYCDPGGSGKGWEPWVSNGTPAGTRFLKDINQGASNSNSYPHGFTHAGAGRAIFLAYTPGTGRELWYSDGVFDTAIVADLAPGPEDSLDWFPSFATVGDKILFPATDGTTGQELWSIPRFTTPPPPDPPADPPGGEPEADPTPPGGTAPDGKGPAPTPADDAKVAGGILVPGPQGTVRGDTLRITVGCEGGVCPRANIAVRLKGRRGPLIARGPVRIAANHKKKVSLRLTARGRKLLAQRERLTVRTAGRGIARNSVQLRIVH